MLSDVVWYWWQQTSCPMAWEKNQFQGQHWRWHPTHEKMLSERQQRGAVWFSASQTVTSVAHEQASINQSQPPSGLGAEKTKPSFNSFCCRWKGNVHTVEKHSLTLGQLPEVLHWEQPSLFLQNSFKTDEVLFVLLQKCRSCALQRGWWRRAW